MSSSGPLGDGPEEEPAEERPDSAEERPEPAENGEMTNGEAAAAEGEEQLALEKLGTGIEILDQRLDGGLPPGSVVSVVASPLSTAELFLYDLATTRKTHYFTTMRSPESIKNNFEILETEPENVEFIDLSGQLQGAATMISEHLKEVGPDENIIVDNFSDLAKHSDRYVSLLDEIYAKSHENGNLTYLYMIESDEDPMGFEEQKVPYLSDVVMKMKQDISGEKVENRLAITKLRGETPPPKTIKLNIGTSVEIDTSRDIA